MKYTFNDLIWDIQYYLIEKPVDFFKQVITYFKNIHFFRKELWLYRPWDHWFCKNMYVRSLEGLHDYILTESIEVDESRIPKCEAMERLLYLLTTQMVQIEELGGSYREHYNATMKEIFEILLGDDEKTIEKRYKKILKEFKKEAWPEVYEHAKLQGFWEQQYLARGGKGCSNWWA